MRLEAKLKRESKHEELLMRGDKNKDRSFGESIKNFVGCWMETIGYMSAGAGGVALLGAVMDILTYPSGTILSESPEAIGYFGAAGALFGAIAYLLKGKRAPSKENTAYSKTEKTSHIS